MIIEAEVMLATDVELGQNEDFELSQNNILENRVSDAGGEALKYYDELIHARLDLFDHQVKRQQNNTPIPEKIAKRVNDLSVGLFQNLAPCENEGVLLNLKRVNELIISREDEGQLPKELVDKIKKIVFTPVFLDDQGQFETSQIGGSVNYLITNTNGEKSAFYKPRLIASSLDAYKKSDGFISNIYAYIIDLGSGVKARVPLAILGILKEPASNLDMRNSLGMIDRREWKIKNKALLENIPLMGEISVFLEGLDKNDGSCDLAELQQQIVFRYRVGEDDNNPGNILAKKNGNKTKLFSLDLDGPGRRSYSREPKKSSYYMFNFVNNEKTYAYEPFELGLKKDFDKEVISWIDSWDIKADAKLLRELAAPASEDYIQLVNVHSMVCKMLCRTHTPYSMLQVATSKPFLRKAYRTYGHEFLDNGNHLKSPEENQERFLLKMKEEIQKLS